MNLIFFFSLFFLLSRWISANVCGSGSCARYIEYRYEPTQSDIVVVAQKKTSEKKM